MRLSENRVAASRIFPAQGHIGVGRGVSTGFDKSGAGRRRGPRDGNERADRQRARQQEGWVGTAAKREEGRGQRRALSAGVGPAGPCRTFGRLEKSRFSRRLPNLGSSMDSIGGNGGVGCLGVSGVARRPAQGHIGIRGRARGELESAQGVCVGQRVLGKGY